MRFDLHTHTTASDGSYHPKELIVKAQSIGLGGIAITDHDTTSGLEEGIKAGTDLSIMVIPGIEFSTDWGIDEVHILGYFIDYNNKRLLKLLNVLKRERWDRGKKIVGNLNSFGLKISWNDVITAAKGGVVGRPHIGQVLIDNKSVSSMKQAFDLYLGKGKPGYVSRFKLTTQQAIEEVKYAGGVPVLAHPGLLKQSEIVKDMLVWGLEGIEAFYPQHTRKQQRLFKKMGESYNLVLTGGSDFHGEKRYSNQLGSIAIPLKTILALKERRGGKQYYGNS